MKLRVSTKEKKAIEEAARQAERSVASWLRVLALNATNGKVKVHA
jgi:hypothetical protein